MIFKLPLNWYLNLEIFKIVKSFSLVKTILIYPNFIFLLSYKIVSRFESFIPLLPAASQMVVADLSEPEKRADALSKLGLCFGIGMIAGSTLGGHLNTRYGWVSLYVCCCVFVLGVGDWSEVRV